MGRTSHAGSCFQTVFGGTGMVGRGIGGRQEGGIEEGQHLPAGSFDDSVWQPECGS
jgi:hypothetical protein